MSGSLRTNLILIIGSFYHYMITKHTMYNYIHYYCDYNLLLCHSRAISLKVLFNCVSRAIFSSRFTSIRSIPPEIPLLASSSFAGASAKVTSGYTPSANSFSLPATRYLRRQYSPPPEFYREVQTTTISQLVSLLFWLGSVYLTGIEFHLGGISTKLNSKSPQLLVEFGGT